MRVHTQLDEGPNTVKRVLKHASDSLDTVEGPIVSKSRSQKECGQGSKRMRSRFKQRQMKVSTVR